MTSTLRARFGPAPDWLSLFLVAVMAVSVAWSLDDSALVLGRGDWTDMLPWTALCGVIAGFVGARVGWNRPLAHLIGAIFAVLIVAILVGSVLDVSGNFGQKFTATANASVDAVLDFAVYKLLLTRQTGHYLLVLGLLCWANGQFAASAVFRQGRPIGPIIVLGAVLVANMSATSHTWQIWYLVLFSLASLFLLIRLHALEERATWIRRRIGDPATVSSLYLRGGTAFIAIAVFFALALTANAKSAPLAGFWDDARPTLIQVSQFLQRIIPPAPDSRPIGFPSFGSQVAVGGLWATASEPALTIQRAIGDKRPIYWRATTYDTFTLQGWTTAVPATADRPAGTPLLEDTVDAIPKTSLRTNDSFTVTPLSDVFQVAFSPLDPVSINRDVTLNLAGADGSVQSIAVSGRSPYTITAAIPDPVDEPGGLTQNRLRAAGTSYPAGVIAGYLGVPSGSMGPSATALLKHVQDEANRKTDGHVTPYDLAAEIVSEFQKSPYQYNTNVLGVCDGESSIVECFADHKIGYCEHFASTMAILLRAAHVPTRLVEGFLPGSLDPSTGLENIRTDGAHAWVEVYFPGYGWQMFDPTGGNRSQTVALPVGAAQPLPSATPVPSLPAPSIPVQEKNRVPQVPGETRDPSKSVSSNPGILVGTAIGLLAAVLLLAFIAWRRGPRDVTTPDDMFGSVAGLARRFGFGPRPTQTAYEYASALGDILPSVRPELQTVATAKVEVAYGRRELGEDRLAALRDAYRRLRVGLLRLAFRRGDRRRMR
jgi:transglutaminase-like putative cysteine protease